MSEAMGMPIIDRVAPEERETLVNEAPAVQRGEGSRVLQFTVAGKHGEERHIQVRGTPILYRGQPASLAIQRDITEQVQIEKELRRVLAQYRATLESTTDGLLVIDEDGHVVVFNQRFADMWGLSSESLNADVPLMEKFGPVLEQLSDPDHFLARVREVRAHHQNEPSMDTLELRDGRIFERYSLPYSPDEAVLGRVWSFRDVTSSRRMEEELRQMALHDSLTLLPNRTLFMDRLNHALSASRRSNTNVAVLFIDMDDFKTFNDRFGHAFGDKVLSTCARRLAASLRPGDTAARIGGDEFAILLDGLHNIESAETVAQRILTILQAPVTVDSQIVHCSMSIGIAYGSESRPEQLLKDADAAMYLAKRSGKGRIRTSRSLSSRSVA